MFLWFVLAWFCAAAAGAQSCLTSSDLDEATRSAVSAAGQRDFDLSSRSDIGSLRQNAVPSLAADFSGVESAIKDNQAALSGAKATLKSLFVLEVQGAGPLAHGEFYCGVFGKNGQTANSAAFYLDNLQPGKYAALVMDSVSAKSRKCFSLILQQMGNEWKLAGLYIRPSTIGGHDSDWFTARAAEFKSKGQTHNAWLYFQEARNLASPLNFMSTAITDRLYDQTQAAQPPDMPANGKTADLAAGAATYKLTAVFPQMVGDDLDLVVKYRSADVSNTNQAYQDNMAVIKAVVTKLPELRDTFAGVVARAVDATGHDYGTLVAMKDIK